MPDNRLSRLLKATLLRRSSTPAVPQSQQSEKADRTADQPSSVPNSTSSGPAPHLFSPEESYLKPRSFSVVSSLPIDSPGFPDEQFTAATTIAGGTGAAESFTTTTAQADCGPFPAVLSKAPQQQVDASLLHSHQNPTTTTEDQQQQEQQQQQEEGHRDRVQSVSTTSSVSKPANSPQQTPLTEAPSTAATTPIGASNRPGGPSPQVAAQYKHREIVGGAAIEPQLTPFLDTVNEYPSGERRAPSSYFNPSTVPKRPTLAVRRQSLLPPSQQHLIDGLLNPGLLFPNGSSKVSSVETEMIAQRKVWVKRPGGSATLVSCMEDWLVDELRDQILRKYGNSIGRRFDSPDILIKVFPREGSNKQSTPERVLTPEESLASVIDTYYPGGQTIEEALVVEVPQRPTPRPSPRHQVYCHHPDAGEHGDYFTLVPAAGHTPPAHGSAPSSASHQTHSISILTTGVARPLPSPGNRSGGRPTRPQLTRHMTNSPTLLGSVSGPKDTTVTPNNQPPSHSQTPSVPTPPVPPESPQTKPFTPPTRGGSPRPGRKPKKPSGSMSAVAAFGGLIEGTVPPINVLIVEDNVINQKLLEAFMKRLSVRWKCAANGEEAVRKWRQGGFHLVLMDIQLPVMNGLEATKEIRRLERLNGIGVFPKTVSGRSSANATSPSERGSLPPRSPAIKEEDTLHDLSLFKSPVIIVALTASSLQSDRHEALAAGCNDFLTKPVGFPWLQQKVTEWGCMQALIDFEGWRKWRGFADPARSSPPPETDSHTSPMQTGSGNGSSSSNLGVPKNSSPSPMVSPRSQFVRRRSQADRDGDRVGSGSTSRRTSNPARSMDAVDVNPEDSSGSSSGSGGATGSPASVVTSVKVKETV